jgi:enoyl-CoA hydratase
MPTEKLIAKKENGVGWIVLNNPERHNAISLDMWSAAMEAMNDFKADKSVRVVVVTGAGGKAFASGADISKFKDERPAAKLGLGYGMNRAKPLVDLVGPAYAKEMFFTGRQFTAQEAEKMGLVNRVVPNDQLESAIEEITRTIVENAPLTVRCAKLVVGEVVKDADKRDVAATERAVAACFASQDYKEGQAAFMEKRKPKFIGA